MHRAVYFNYHAGTWVWECKTCVRQSKRGVELPGKIRSGGHPTKVAAILDFINTHENTPAHIASDPEHPQRHTNTRM